MYKLLVISPHTELEEIKEVTKTGNYFDIDRVLHDERIDGPLPQSKIDEINSRKEEERANIEYKSLRRAEYGSIEDQLDEIYWDFDAWQQRIGSIKAKYPKPE